MTPPAVVIGIGNRYRRDDGLALKVLETLTDRIPTYARLVESDGEPARVIDSWEGADLAVIVETVLRGDPPGTIAMIDWDTLPPAGSRQHEHGSHSLGVLEAIALGRAVDRVPRHLRLVGIEPLDLGWGEGLSGPVADSIEHAARIVLDCLQTDVKG